MIKEITKSETYNLCRQQYIDWVENTEDEVCLEKNIKYLNLQHGGDIQTTGLSETIYWQFIEAGGKWLRTKFQGTRALKGLET